MTRSKRFVLILGLLAFVGLAAVGWMVFRAKFPNAFDRETVSEDELARLKTADLTRAVPTGIEWPQFRGPNRDGWGSDAGLNTDWNAKPPKKQWGVPCGGGYSSLAVVNNRVYSQDKQGSDERVFCLDAATGQPIWEHRYPVDYSGFKLGYAFGPRATPTVDGKRVYTVGATGLLLCLQEGPNDIVTRLWGVNLMAEFRAPLPSWGFACSPLIDGDLVIVQAGGKDGSIVAFDKATGGKRWTAEADRNGYSSPILATLGGVRQVVAVTAEAVVGLRPETGEVLWRQPWVTQFDGNATMPVIASDYVFVSSSYNKGCALFRIATTGSGCEAKVVYFRPNKVMRTHHATCIHKDGFVYGFDNDDFKCVDLRTGTEVEDWLPPEVAGRLRKGGVIAVGNHLIGLTQTGTLFIGRADPKEFALTGRVEKVLNGAECWAMPAVVDGRIYLRDATQVLCLDARK